MKRHLKITLLAGALSLAGIAQADVSVPVQLATDKGPGADAGTVSLSESKYGLVLTPNLKGLPPGVHGFHVHENGNCDAKQQDGKMVPAGAAGGHYDPDGTKSHGAPWDDGAHRGDLPALYVNADGTATTPVLAPRLKLAEVQGRGLMVHAGGDNHSDHPKPLGGGGGRIACGVIPK
ncbi:superoxide dismutase [Cu-Zn] SodC [Bordetella petrii]|uniref:superoxide dismutase [Cu-Zn] SodC n=1 Tax=Bordetella petrii TaxID=94624 RepID=UPI00372FD5C1